ncbi:hypothetical protein BO71DRAFT_409488 [Aspergillus ellipticus CBS 707.79]|uniref:Uncharacterized protein n=1 Tax=Aspergillus ellipticus CBS 707.79 TaxID=1448320 RepID=A0A319DAM1_9EURO|nr:hypothetical protein BO71DRAFT_409488 [Aspergillus ellipticus CBS 707.79]
MSCGVVGAPSLGFPGPAGQWAVGRVEAWFTPSSSARRLRPSSSSSSSPSSTRGSRALLHSSTLRVRFQANRMTNLARPIPNDFPDSADLCRGFWTTTMRTMWSERTETPGPRHSLLSGDSWRSAAVIPRGTNDRVARSLCPPPVSTSQARREPGDGSRVSPES